ncbi:RecQ family ATP-dependent DNA helicase [Jeotgalibacillus proteolyticus]|uniref:ATP-dependent DNA helicase RecQ n=1 Tax=Jeotgalibacillus proteolyticus TaxID=2082395 RepID=A0A2S5GE80_9BACL|nr:RecQ family ATP-dependent DNA helicase [Jeotgalibacillus proteolyticus]PPA71289.1 ATP-dependent DNA helicase [Jeotgalibacillus proteolyticus]
MEEILYRKFGFTSFREGQKEIIESVVSGKDTVAMLPTGSGKSLCYQMPSYLLNIQVLIVSPLLSLMQDQVEQIKYRGEKSVIALNSFLPYKEKVQALHNLRQFRFIFISPEMLVLPEVKKALASCLIRLFVVDEAHCISQWGPDFRPDYMLLGEVKKQLGSPVTLALTATATQKIRSDIRTALKLSSPAEWVYSVNRPNIALNVKQIDSFQQKIEILKEYMRTISSPGIVYFSSKRLADELAAEMHQHLDRQIASYHAGLDTEQRILIQQQFLNDQLDWIFATSAFGMGVNKENIRTVIHFHMPSSMESFVQEIGRAGRDGKKSVSILLYLKGDEKITGNLLELENLSLRQINEYKKIRQETVNQKVVEEKAGISEIQYRVLNYFEKHENHKNWEENVFRLMSDRLRERKEQLTQMTFYATSPTCRRRLVIESFNEREFSSKAHCCDVCGLNLEDFSTEDKGAGSAAQSWEKRLARLLLV